MYICITCNRHVICKLSHVSYICIEHILVGWQKAHEVLCVYHFRLDIDIEKERVNKKREIETKRECVIEESYEGVRESE